LSSPEPGILCNFSTYSSVYLRVKGLNRTIKEWLYLGSLVLLFSGLANAQTPTASVPDANIPATTNLVQANQQYKASSQELLKLQQRQVTEAETMLEDLRSLVTNGLVARSELEASEQTLVGLRAQVEATQKRITDNDSMIAEIQAEQELAKAPAAKQVKLISKPYGTLTTTATILRYNGVTAWSLGGLGAIQTFFSVEFGHSLPTSAVGQSATHNRLGYDHRNAVDVAVHPDSTEGRALISYLQGQGIPFLAFRAAIPGVATGPHNHIGSPSHRLS
jgi:hypothetical protein